MPRRSSICCRQKNVLRVGSSPLAISSTDGFETQPLFHYTVYAGVLVGGCGLLPNLILKYAPSSYTFVKSDYLDAAVCWSMTSWPKRMSAGARFILITVTLQARALRRSRTRFSLPIPRNQLLLAIPTMDLTTKTALLWLMMIEVASAVMIILWPQEGLGHNCFDWRSLAPVISYYSNFFNATGVQMNESPSTHVR